MMEQRSNPENLAPEATAERVELYFRTYRTLLRSAGETRLRTLERPHIEMMSSLHSGAGRPEPDAGALIYAMQRLPAAIMGVGHVIMGQSVEAISSAIGVDAGRWQPLTAPGRRRRWLWNGGDAIAVLVASETDVDDLIPTLVALQIEWNKLHLRLQAIDLSRDDLLALWRRLDIGEPDWLHLIEIIGEGIREWLAAVRASEKDFRVRTVGGTHSGFARAVRRWWTPIAAHLRNHGMDGQPVYFVSSNTHSLVNLVSGVAAEHEREILEFVARENHPELAPELDKLRSGASRASWANFLYFAARHYFAAHPETQAEREAREREAGITYIAPDSAVDVAAQIIPLNRLRPQWMDARLGAVPTERLTASPAVIVNIDYPLGLTAYRILRVLSEDTDRLAGVYVLGKAATLNASVGDVMVSYAVRDEHTGNTYWLDNCFGAEDVAPYLLFGSALDGQEAVTVLGTFLQNRGHLEMYYREMYTVVEMEAGPYLSAAYEASHPTRHPMGEHVNLARLPFDLGILHYASDTPYTQARTLGARGLSYRGMDSTYAGAIAILRRIFAREGVLPA